VRVAAPRGCAGSAARGAALGGLACFVNVGYQQRVMGWVAIVLIAAEADNYGFQSFHPGATRPFGSGRSQRSSGSAVHSSSISPLRQQCPIADLHPVFPMVIDQGNRLARLFDAIDRDARRIALAAVARVHDGRCEPVSR